MKIQTIQLDNGRLFVNTAFSDLLRRNGINSAEALWSLEGQGVKEVAPDRGTTRVFLKTSEGDDVELFLKKYQPAGISARLKALACLKKPRIFDGIHEWNAILAFHYHGIPTITPVAAARLGAHTCNLTLGIQDYTRLSDLAKNPRLSPAKRHLLARDVATIAGRMHRAGFTHQDFYLVHIFASNRTGALHLIDLQRVIMENPLKHRWRIKDLAQLLFSARDCCTALDQSAFLATYRRVSGIDLTRHPKLLKAINAKARRIERHHRRHYENQEKTS